MTATVYINGRFLSQRLSGVQRYAHETLNELDKILSEQSSYWRLVVLVPKKSGPLPSWTNIEIRRTGSFSGHLWEQIDLPIHARDGLLINFISSAPLASPNQIVTFHDAAIFDEPQLFSRLYGLLHRTLRPLLGRRAKAIVTVSEFSQRRLSETLGISEAKFNIIGNGCDHILKSASNDDVLARGNLKIGGYILCVGATPNKNLQASLEAFRQSGLVGFRFAVAGASPASVFGPDGGQVNDLSVVNLGYVSDQELRALYENAALFSFPSLYEGFGIPPLEAMTLGCPTVANNVCAMPEVLGDAALLIDASDPKAFAAAMLRCLDSDQRADIIAKGRSRAASFSWRAAAQKWHALITTHAGGAPVLPQRSA